MKSSKENRKLRDIGISITIEQKKALHLIFGYLIKYKNRITSNGYTSDKVEKAGWDKYYELENKEIKNLFDELLSCYGEKLDHFRRKPTKNRYYNNLPIECVDKMIILCIKHSMPIDGLTTDMKMSLLSLNKEIFERIKSIS